jgi:folate-binding protein YgfZ
MTQLHHLPDRCVLRLSGADLRPFLQGIITNDIARLSADAPLFAAMLSPQGKFQHDFFLIIDGDDILCETETALKDALLKKLKLYKLRSQVTLTDESAEWNVYATSGEQPSIAIIFTDPRHPQLGSRILSRHRLDATDATAYERHRLTLGIPDGSRDASERAVIMELGYDQLHAISFTKGCYVGQEVTARMHYRKILRKCLYIVESAQPLPPIGSDIFIGTAEKPVGEMRSSLGHIGLAFLRIEAVESGETLHSNSIELSARLPDYMTAKLDEIRSHSAIHPPV